MGKRAHVHTHIHTTCTGILAVYRVLQHTVRCSPVSVLYCTIQTSCLHSATYMHSFKPIPTHSTSLSFSIYLCPVHVTLLPTFPCFNRTCLKGQQFILHYVVDKSLALFREILDRNGMWLRLCRWFTYSDLLIILWYYYKTDGMDEVLVHRQLFQIN